VPFRVYVMSSKNTAKLQLEITTNIIYFWICCSKTLWPLQETYRRTTHLWPLIFLEIDVFRVTAVSVAHYHGTFVVLYSTVQYCVLVSTGFA
jgi:hypothetical protein